VRRARDLGFSVEQMKTLLAQWRDRSRASADVKAIALEQVAELERKAAAIAEMTKTLKHLVNNGHGDSRPDCPIIEGFAEGKGKVHAAPAKEGRESGSRPSEGNVNRAIRLRMKEDGAIQGSRP
jgi:MerR family copper efflux transcriptional regulator